MLALLAESALRSLLLGSVVWIGLHFLAVRNPHVQMTAWVMVLLASLSMPALMHWATVTVTLHSSPLPAPENFWPAQGWSTLEPLHAQSLPAAAPSQAGASVEPHVATRISADGWVVATVVYACVAAALLLRLLVGLCLTWRMVRAAKRIHEPWVAGADVRVSDAISGPVAFGSIVLLPAHYSDWDRPKRQAVLAHEGAHVAHGDFYILLLASLNRAVFWFSPFAWWHLMRLAELAEIISDVRAIEVIKDRVSYAEILLDLMQKVRQVPAGLEMARAYTVQARVERILGAAAMPARAGWRGRSWTAAVIAPVVIISAGSIAYRTVPDAAPAEIAATAHKLQQADFYALGPASIFAILREDDGLFGQLTSQRKARLATEPNGSYAYRFSAGEIVLAANDQLPAELTLRRNGQDVHAVRIAHLADQVSEARSDGLDSYAGWYELSPSRVLAVTRDGDRIHVQATGQARYAIAARGGDAFVGGHGELVMFMHDDQANVTKVLFQDPLSGAHVAPRITDDRARAIEDEFARRIAEVPDRFRDQIPTPGSKEAILRGIEDLRRGTPNYNRMSATLAANIRRQASQTQALLIALGQVESIFFRGVGPGGYDIYGVKFANGSAEFRISLTADGKADDVLFRPDGNEAPGGIAACSEERNLKSHGDTSPIKLFFFNDSGSDINLSKLGAEGNRIAQGTIGDNMSTSVLTSVDNPLIVTDASGHCLEIVLPGQRTRYLTVDASPIGIHPEQAARRFAPLPGSEEMLRQYIEALGRGEPNYERMTPEVAAQTRAQLSMDQAILGRLGALRAVSFRGVTAFGSDIYMAHFANGTAEWRISLVKDGMIGRIALGPQ
jgi:beta-lactamase regulating signal transducer with metallopeptidase domain